MARAVSSAQVERRETVVGPNTYLTSRFFEAPAERGAGPQGFLVEFPAARGVIRPHFHRVDQFQVVVEGSGRLGKHPVRPIAVHYTDGFTPYGPIVAEDDGITFYTLRAEADSGAHYMPGSRDKLERRAGRGLSWEPPAEAASGRRGAAEALASHFTPHADGLSAYSLRVGPGATVAGPDPSSGGGQYYLVVEGALAWGDQQLPPRSLVFVGPDDAPLEATAGVDGLTALILQFPRRQPG